MHTLKTAVVAFGGCTNFGGKHIKRKSEMFRMAWVQVVKQTAKHEIRGFHSSDNLVMVFCIMALHIS
jgi:hypothetical protein